MDDVGIKIVLDVDTGTDDALAILYAVSHPDLDVLGISCVAGNSGLDQVVTNTAKVLDAAGCRRHPDRRRRSSAVAGAGAPGGGVPWRGRPRRDTAARLGAHSHHRDRGRAAAPPDHGLSRPGHAGRRWLRRPMSRMLLALHPEVATNLDRIVFMGGSAGSGNITAVAEFNVWQDPEAASCVIESGIPTTMYGLDVFTRLPDRPGDRRPLQAAEPPGDPPGR